MSLPRLTPPLRSTPDAVKASAPTTSAKPGPAWTVLGEIGILLAVVGGVDFLLLWFPPAFGNPEWEFGAVTATLDGLPALTVGLALALGSALSLRKRRLGRAISVVFALLGVTLIALSLLYLTTLPLAWRSVTDELMQVGLLKAVGKTLVQSAMYPAIFLWIAAKGWRHTAPERIDPLS